MLRAAWHNLLLKKKQIIWAFEKNYLFLHSFKKIMGRNKIFINRLHLIFLLLFVFGFGIQSLNAVASAHHSDSIQIYRNMTIGEGSNLIRMRMVHSAFPVQIKVRGKSLQVTSKFNQILPVYNAGGAFYGVFKLNKGTNWINGLPRGTYYINNTKVTIS